MSPLAITLFAVLGVALVVIGGVNLVRYYPHKKSEYLFSTGITVVSLIFIIFITSGILKHG